MTIIQKVKSGLHFCLWMSILAVIEVLWFLIPLDYLWYFWAIIGGSLCIGLISRFSPEKAFLAGFIGYLTISLLHANPYSGLIVNFVSVSIFLGLIAMTGAIIRRVLLGDFEELYLSGWKQVILIGGCSAYADYIIFSAAFLVLEFQNYFQFFIGVTKVSIGIFALGVYAGAFFNKEYENPIQKIKKFSLGGHTGFVLYIILLLFMGFDNWRAFLFLSFIAVFLGVIVIGAYIGYWYHSRH